MKRICAVLLALSLALPVRADFTSTDSSNLNSIRSALSGYIDIDVSYSDAIVDLLNQLLWCADYLYYLHTADLPAIESAVVGLDSDVAGPLANAVSTLYDISDALDVLVQDFSLSLVQSWFVTLDSDLLDIYQGLSDVNVTAIDGFGTTSTYLGDILSVLYGISTDDQVTALNNIAQTLSGLAADMQNGAIPPSDDLAGVIETAIEGALHDWNPTIDVGGGTIDANVDFSEFDYSYFVSASEFANLQTDVADIRNSLQSIDQYLTLPNYSLDYSVWGWSVAPGPHMAHDSGQKRQMQVRSADFFSVATAAFQGLLSQGDSMSDALRQLIYLASSSLSSNSSDVAQYSVNADYYQWVDDWPLDAVSASSVELQALSESNLSFKDMVYKYLTVLAKQGRARDQSLLQLIWSLKGTNASEVADFSSDKMSSLDEESGELFDFEYFANDSNIGDKFRPPVAIDNVESSISRVKGVWSDAGSTQPQQLDFDFGQWHGFGNTGGVGLAMSVSLSSGGQSAFYANFRKAAKFVWWGLFVSIVFFICLLVVRLVHFVNSKLQLSFVFGGQIV